MRSLKHLVRLISFYWWEYNCGMLLQVQTIQVEVTKLPVQPGMSEWAKTLISAGIGAVFAILTTLITEFVKAKQVKASDLKELKDQVIPELRESLDRVETLRRMVKRAAEGTRDDRTLSLTFGQRILATVSDDRYAHGFEKQKALMYKIDPDKTLQNFYSFVRSAHDATVSLDYASLIHYIRRASEEGRKYLAAHEIEYEATPDSNWDRYIPEPVPGTDNPESYSHELTKTGAFTPTKP
jgi:hypothetical protein